MSAENILVALDELAAELGVRDSPERRAWEALHPTRHGWTEPYQDEAQRIWNGVLARHADDLTTVHHLALVHHARAIDLEQSPYSDRSDPNWRRALELWFQLWQSDSFWDRLPETGKGHQDVVQQVRHDLAVRLLRMHFDIALDEGTPLGRAQAHVRFAVRSRFPDELVEHVRRRAYERVADSVDGRAWQPDTVDAEVLEPAIEVLLHYLDRDPENLRALRDLLGLAGRLQLGQVAATNHPTAGGEEDAGLARIRATTEWLDGHLERLGRMLVSAAEPDEYALDELARWLWNAGQAGDDADRSVKLLRRAARAAQAGRSPDAQRIQDDCQFAMALNALRHATDERLSRAREVLTDMAAPDELPASALVLRARAWLMLHEPGRAEADARQALVAMDQGTHDDSRYGEPGELRVAGELVLRRARIEPHLERARAAVERESFEGAIAHLDRALRVDPDSVEALMGRAQCHLAQHESEQALKDLERAARLSARAGDQEALRLIRELRDDARTLHEQVRRFGGPAASRWMREAGTALTEGRKEDAVRALRRAHEHAATGAARREIGSILASHLNATAVERANRVAARAAQGLPYARGTYSSEHVAELMSGRVTGDALLDAVSSLFADSDSVVSTLDSCAATLREAISLDPQRVYRTNLSQVLGLRDQVRQRPWY